MFKKGFLWLGLILAGCGQFPNPNDLSSVSPDSKVSVAYTRLESAEVTLQFKVERGEISDEKRNEMIRELSEDMLKTIDAKSIPYEDQWKYADLLRVTDRWAEAEEALITAVKAADSADRKINDTLKLSQAQAKNGKVSDSIKTAESVMKADDKDASPILLSVLYEIIPAAEKKGHDKDLAKLLTDAIQCHLRVKVDRNSDAGRQFLIARRYHLKKAQEKLTELLGSAT